MTAYTSSGAVADSVTVTASDGSYTLTLAPGDYRLEITGLSSGFFPSPTSGGQTTRFVSDSSTQDFAQVSFTDACDANPLTFTPCYVVGDPSLPSVAVMDAAVAFRFDDSGNSTANKVMLATAAEIGTTWGAAYDPIRNKAYLSTVVRRHAALGPAGVGGIYSIDISDLGSPSVSTLVTVPNANPAGYALDNTSRGITGDLAGDPSADLGGFQAVGRAGLGDIDISADGNTLYAVNVGSNSLVQIDLNSNAITSTLPIYANIPAAAQALCDVDEFRPWALEIDGADVYLGAVCSGEEGGTLRAFIFRLNGSSFDLVHEHALPLTGRDTSWTRPDAAFGSFDATVRAAFVAATQWKPWVGTLATDWPATTASNVFGGGDLYTTHAQAMLSDMEKDGDDFILGFNDRHAMVGGFQNFNPSGTGSHIAIGAGDLIRLSFSSITGTYSPDAANAEFYGAEEFLQTAFQSISGADPFEHQETSFGSLALKPDSSSVMTTVFDPIPDQFNAGGVKQMNNTTGAEVADSAFEIYGNASAGITFAKAAGLGDLEIACDTPIKVGDRFFIDTDQDGQQDIGELGVSGVTLQIYDSAGDPVGGVITTGTDGFWQSPELLSGSDYCLVVEASNFASNAILDGFQATTPNASGVANNLDSELGTISGQTGDLAPFNGSVGICFNSGTETTFDFDLGVVDSANLPGIGNLVWIEGSASNNGVFNENPTNDPTGDQVVSGAVVQLFAQGDDPLTATPVASDITDSAGCYELRGPAGTYFVYLPGSNFSGPLSGAFSIPGNGGDDQGDDDSLSSADNGIDSASPATTGISSLDIELIVGGEPLDASETGKDGMGDSPDESVDYTVDFGFILAPSMVSKEAISDSPSSNVAIPGGGTLLNRTFVIADSCTVLDVDLGLKVESTEVNGADRTVVAAYLISPAGTRVNLADVGGAYGNGRANINVLFDDDLATANYSAEAFVAGTHNLGAAYSARTYAPISALSAFDGENGQGTWTLELSREDGGFFANEFVEAELCVQCSVSDPKVGVGNLVFIDLNENGSFDEGFDQVVEGVSVELLVGSTVVATTETDEEGCYLFVTDPGTYTVRIPASEFQAGEPLEAVSASVVGAGTIDTSPTDDSGDENGVDPVPNTLTSLQASGVSSASFTLVAGAEPEGNPTSGVEAGKGGDSDDLVDSNVDLTVDFGFTVVIERDWGDAPEAESYATISASNGPRHILGEDLFIGTLVDGDDGSQEGAGAEADDNDTALNDEDGIVTASQLKMYDGQVAPTITVSVENGSGAAATLYGWLDFNGDGTFDNATERASVAVADGVDGNVNLVFPNVPATASLDSGDDSILRLRLSSDIAAADPTGEASDGEVEDHLVVFCPPMALGNVVFIDADNDGVFDIGEGVNGVDVELYSSTQTVGVDTPLLTTSTTVDGNYLFDNLFADSYLVYLPSGNFASGEPLEDTQSITGAGGDDAFDDNVDENGLDTLVNDGVVSAVITLEEGLEPTSEAGSSTGPSSSLDDNMVNLTIDFGFNLEKPQSFTAWQIENPLGGNNAPLENGDGDLASNLIEYALCLKADSGLKVFPDGTTANNGFELVLNDVTDELDACYNRPADATDVTYTLMTSSDGTTWTDVPTSTLAPVVTSTGPGTEKVTYPDVETALGTSGLLLVRVTLDNGSSTIDSATSAVVGWQNHTVEQQCETFAEPFLGSCLFSGSGSVTGSVVDLTSSLGGGDLTTVLSSTEPHYIEIATGDFCGHRFEIASFTATTITLAEDLDLYASDPCNTSLTIPDFSDDTILISTYRTLDELFPPSLFQAGTNALTGDNVLFYDRTVGSLKTFYLLEDGATDKWVMTGSSDDLGGTPICPADGLFTHHRAAAFSFLQYGAVRGWKAIVPLKAGYNLVPSMYPVNTSAMDRAMSELTGFTGTGDPATADQYITWRGDTVVGHECYDGFFYTKVGSYDQWTSVGDVDLISTSEEDDFLRDRSAFYCVQDAGGNPTFTIPLAVVPPAPTSVPAP